MKGISTTTPVCVEVDGMDSPTTIPNNELTVDDSSVIVGNLRPSSPIPLKSTKGTLMIEYLPQTSRPIGTVELVSTKNIARYTVKFFNTDGTVTSKVVSVYLANYQKGILEMRIVIKCTNWNKSISSNLSYFKLCSSPWDIKEHFANYVDYLS